VSGLSTGTQHRKTQEDTMQRPTGLEIVSLLIPALFLLVGLAAVA
jgi:hypothetical protein